MELLWLISSLKTWQGSQAWGTGRITPMHTSRSLLFLAKQVEVRSSHLNKIPLRQGTVAWKIQHIILRSKTGLSNGGERDPVRLFEELISHRPEGLKNSCLMYLTIIPRPKTASWYSRTRMVSTALEKIINNVCGQLFTSGVQEKDH